MIIDTLSITKQFKDTNVKLLNKFLISNFLRVLNVVCFLLGNSQASEFYMETLQNTLSVPSSWLDIHPPMKMEHTVFQNFSI